MELKPIGKRVFIKLDDPTKPTGIVASANEISGKPKTGTIAFIGDDCKEGRFVKGDKVYLGDSYPKEETIGGEKYVIMMEDGVISIIPTAIN